MLRSTENFGRFLLIVMCLSGVTSVSAQDAKSGLATLEIWDGESWVNVTWSKLSAAAQAEPLPDFLKDAEAFQHRDATLRRADPDDILRSRLKLRAKTAGTVVIGAFSYSLETPFGQDADWYRVQSKKDLVDLGWQPFHFVKISQNEESLPCVLFRKEAKAGEVLSIRTHMTRGPLVIWPSKTAAAMRRLPAWTITHNDIPTLTAIPDIRQAVAPPKCVMLTTQMLQEWDVFAVQGMLTRELMRQSFLIAARDELGLSTRDQTLRETFAVAQPQAGFRPALELQGAVDVSRAFRLTLFRNRIDAAKQAAAAKPSTSPAPLGRGGDCEVLFDERVAFESPQPARSKDAPPQVRQTLSASDFPELSAEVERLSRTAYVQALKKAGYTGQRNTWKADEKISADLEADVAEFDLIRLWSAIRRLHGLLRTSGESPVRLAALSRAYANLGSVTEVFWSPAHKAFKARALLYAERLVSKSTAHPEALRVRAYARMLTGMHADALRDLSAADDIEKRDRPKSLGIATEWSGAVRAAAEFDRGTLMKLAQFPKESDAKPANAKLANLAEYFLVVNTADNDVLLLRQAVAMPRLERRPDCLRTIELLASLENVGSNRLAVEQFMADLPNVMYDRIAALDNLPSSVRDVLKTRPAEDEPEISEMEFRADLIAALKAAGRADEDTDEFSWAILGQLLEEMTFQHAQRRLQLEFRILAVPTNESLATLRPVVRHHPWSWFLQLYSGKRQPLIDAWQIGRERFVMTEMDLPVGYELLRVPQELQDKSFLKATSLPLTRNLDDTHHDVIVQGRQFKRVSEQIMMLQRISPHSPVLAADLIRAEWLQQAPDKRARALADAEQHKDEPMVLAAAAQWLVDHAHEEDAIKVMRRQQEIFPDFETTFRLAALFEKQGNTEQWLATLEGSLGLPAPGLQPYRVREKLARHYLKLKDFDKALTYAEAAAECYSQWGLLVAADCHEAMEHWNEAAEIQAACADRYPGSRPTWFWFCARTGHGDFEAARTAMRAYVLEKLPEKITNDEANRIAFFAMIAADRQESLRWVQMLSEKTKLRSLGFYSALLADELQLDKERDQFLQDTYIHLAPEKRPLLEKDVYHRTVQLLEADLKRGGKAQFTLDQIDALYNTKTDDGWLTLAHFWVARYVSRHGTPAQAERHYRWVATSPKTSYELVSIARQWLREQKLEIGPTRSSESGQSNRIIDNPNKP